MDRTLHGGDVSHFAAELQCSPDEILDFSANINPRGLPASARSLSEHSTDKLLRYPDWKRHTLRRVLADRHSVPIESVVVGAGASALLLDAFRAIRPVRCLCFVPAFAEYRRACEAAGAEFHSAPLLDGLQFGLTLDNFKAALKRMRPDLIVLNNPHNPSGSLISRNTMETMLHVAAGYGTAVLMDEAFIDYSPADAVTTIAAVLPRVIAIRSLTKFYGCPGLRVGYLVTAPPLAANIERQMPAWPVGTLAMDLLESAMRDKEYERTTLDENARERARFAADLTALRLSPHPSSANFHLLRLPHTWPSSSVLQHDLLIRHRILIRDCSSFEGLEPNRYIRVAVLSRQQNERLVEALQSFV